MKVDAALGARKLRPLSRVVDEGEQDRFSPAKSPSSRASSAWTMPQRRRWTARRNSSSAVVLDSASVIVARVLVARQGGHAHFWGQSEDQLDRHAELLTRSDDPPTGRTRPARTWSTYSTRDACTTGDLGRPRWLLGDPQPRLQAKAGLAFGICRGRRSQCVSPTALDHAERDVVKLCMQQPVWN